MFGVSNLISDVNLVSSVFVSVFFIVVIVVVCVVFCIFFVGSSIFISLGTLRSSMAIMLTRY